MKRLFLLLLIPILLCACTRNEAVAESSTESVPYLEISTQQWSGWSPDAEFEVHTERYELVQGCEIELECYKSLFVTVNTFSDNAICLTFSKPLSVVANGSYNLLDTKTETTISNGETVSFATPSMDAGFIYSLTYVAKTGE